jgi:hypothetical protein
MRFDALDISIFAKLVQEKCRRATQFADIWYMQFDTVDLLDRKAAVASAKVFHVYYIYIWQKHGMAKVFKSFIGYVASNNDNASRGSSLSNADADTSR